MSVRILRGDCREVLKTLPDESVHCVVTSPPYWGLRDYGVEGQLGLEATPYEFVDRMVEVFRDVRRVLRADGTLWLNLGDCYATGAGAVGDHPGGGEQGARWRGEVDRLRDDKRGYRGERLANGRGDQPAVLRQKSVGRGPRLGDAAGKHEYTGVGPMTQPNRMPIPGLKPKDLVGAPWRVALALQADGWWLRQDIIWQKPNPMPESVRDRCTKSHEYIFLLTKSERYYFDQDAILEPSSDSTHARLSQDVQNQVGSDRANAGARRDGRPMRAMGKKPVAGWDTGAGGHCTLAKNRPQDDGDSRKLLRDVGVGDKARPRKAAPNGSGVKNNESFDAAMAIMPLYRNKRSVWTVPTEGFKEAHFATFPTALIEPCILAGTSAHGHCEKCGAGWVRVFGDEQPAAGRASGNKERQHRQEHGGLLDDPRHQAFAVPWEPTAAATVAWRPTCKCDAGVVPGVVLDLFGGAGTTGLVADRNQRNAILIELNPAYADIAERRIVGDAPLFVEVSA